MRRAQKLADEHPEWAFLYQYANEANPRAHYEGTGPEIWRDCPEITHFVAGLGTTGTLMGVGRYLKEQNPEVKIIAIEPPLGERVEGLRNLDEGYIPPVYEKWGGPGPVGPQAHRAASRVDRVDPPADRGRHLLGHLGRRRAGRGGQGGRPRSSAGTIVVILADGGWKYLSTGAWTGDLDEVVALTETPHRLLGGTPDAPAKNAAIERNWRLRHGKARAARQRRRRERASPASSQHSTGQARGAVRAAAVRSTLSELSQPGSRRPDPLDRPWRWPLGRTRKLKLGTSVLVVPGRNPVVLAKELASAGPALRRPAAARGGPRAHPCPPSTAPSAWSGASGRACSTRPSA